MEGDEIDIVEQDCETRVNTWLQAVDSSEVSSESTVQDSAIPNTDQNTVTEEHTGKLTSLDPILNKFEESQATLTEETTEEPLPESPPKTGLGSLVRHWEILSQDQIQISRNQNRTRSTVSYLSAEQRYRQLSKGLFQVWTFFD